MCLGIHPHSLNAKISVYSSYKIALCWWSFPWFQTNLIHSIRKAFPKDSIALFPQNTHIICLYLCVSHLILKNKQITSGPHSLILPEKTVLSFPSFFFFCINIIHSLAYNHWQGSKKMQILLFWYLTLIVTHHVIGPFSTRDIILV